MSTKTHGRLALIALAAITALTGLTAPAHAVDTGTISGHFTDAAGAPLANIMVGALPNGPGNFGSATTDAEGAYQITGLNPGQYRVSFRPWDGPQQYAPGKTSYSNAGLYSVDAGATVTVDDRLLPTATIQGTLVNRQGQGVDGAQVVFWPVDWNEGAYDSTYTSAGQFSKKVFTGKYLVQFYLGTFDPGQGRYFQVARGSDGDLPGEIFDATAGSTIVVNETLLPGGSLSGRFTDANGNGIQNVDVIVTRDGVQMPHAHTDANGNYAFPYIRESGQWRIQFVHYGLGFNQYAYGKLNEADATRITITEGQPTVVNDSRLPTGSLKVKAVDAVTGLPIDRFDASFGRQGYGSTETGEVVLDLPVGTHIVSVDAQGYEHLENAGTVEVVAGQQVTFTARMQPVASIETRVVDAVTGEPVAGVCLVVADPLRFMLPDGCGYESTPSGSLLIEATPGWHQVFAFPVNASGYGAQWVGANGGTGSQLEAKLIKVETGKAAKAPIIKLDRAGTITGQVHTPTGGVPNYGSVSPGDWSPRAGGGLGVVSLDEQGRYTIDTLGPYRWPLRFAISDAGVQWSGQTGNRLLAQTIQVTRNATTTYNFTYKTPVNVSVTLTGVTGDCYVTAFNVVTGDDVGGTWLENCATQRAEFKVVGPQIVKFRVDYLDGENWRQRWYDHAVVLPGSGTKNVTIAF